MLTLHGKFSANQASLIHVCYFLTNDKDQSIYHVGVAPLCNLLLLPDAKKHKSFDNNLVLHLGVISFHSSHHEAINAQGKALASMRPEMPTLLKQTITNRATVIKCNESGQMWATLQDCARDNGLHYSQLCNHVNGKPYFKHVGGRTYSRIPCPDPMIIAKHKLSRKK